MTASFSRGRFAAARWILGVVLASACAIFWTARGHKRGDRQALEPATPAEVDLGSVALDGDAVSRRTSFAWRNVGDAGLSLAAAIPSCGCMAVIPDRETVGPGETLVVTVDTTIATDGPFRSTVDLLFEPGPVVARCVVLATGRRSASLSLIGLRRKATTDRGEEWSLLLGVTGIDDPSEPEVATVEWRSTFGGWTASAGGGLAGGSGGLTIGSLEIHTDRNERRWSRDVKVVLEGTQPIRVTLGP